MFDGKIQMFQVSLVKSIKLQKHPLKSMGEKTHIRLNPYPKSTPFTIPQRP
jgi:hypothetical protein